MFLSFFSFGNIECCVRKKEKSFKVNICIGCYSLMISKSLYIYIVLRFWEKNIKKAKSKELHKRFLFGIILKKKVSKNSKNATQQKKRVKCSLIIIFWNHLNARRRRRVHLRSGLDSAFLIQSLWINISCFYLFYVT